MKRNIIISIILIFIASLSGCTIQKPSEADARKVFENNWAWNLQTGSLEIISFRKVQERTEKKLGIEFYIIEYEAELKVSNFTENDWQQLRFGGYVEKKEETPEGEIVNAWGEIGFAKTMKGWKGEDGEVY